MTVREDERLPGLQIKFATSINYGVPYVRCSHMPRKPAGYYNFYRVYRIPWESMTSVDLYGVNVSLGLSDCKLLYTIIVCLFHSFTLTLHLDNRYAGYRNCNHPCLSIDTVPLRANDLKTLSQPVVALLGPRLRRRCFYGPHNSTMEVEAPVDYFLYH